MDDSARTTDGQLGLIRRQVSSGDGVGFIREFGDDLAGFDRVNDRFAAFAAVPAGGKQQFAGAAELQHIDLAMNKR
jgi:hypothetical protein